MAVSAALRPDRFSTRLRRMAESGLRPAVHLAREVAARAVLAPRRRGRGPMAVFLPASPPEGAALLRSYAIAEALRPLGWRTAVLPWRLTLAARRRCLAALAPDVVVMQGSRHALNRPCFYPEWPVIYDIDDADFHLPHLAGPVTAAMAEVAAVIAGSRYIADWARANGAGRADVVWTGTPVSARPRPPQAGRPAVVAWAQTRPATYTGEAALVARVMAEAAFAAFRDRLTIDEAARPVGTTAAAVTVRTSGLASERQDIP